MAAVTLPDQIWGRLATVAADRGVKIEDLLVAAVREVVKPRSRRERVLAYVRAGYTDAGAAEATGELKSYVGDVRRAAGLPPNRPGSIKEEA